jgi:transposase
MWWTRGERPTGVCDRRFTFAYIFGAAKIGSDDAFALVMPEANTEAMQIFLDAFSKTLPSDEIAIMFADQAGWHKANALAVPANVHLLPIPAYTPEVNPVERIWLYLKERYLSHRLHADYDSIVDATCAAWNKLRQETGRIASLCTYPWLEKCLAAVRI